MFCYLHVINIALEKLPRFLSITNCKIEPIPSQRNIVLCLLYSKVVYMPVFMLRLKAFASRIAFSQQKKERRECSCTHIAGQLNFGILRVAIPW